MESYINKCAVCDSSRLADLKDYQAAHLVKCGNCGFVFSRKIPSPKEIMDLYDDYSRDDYLSPVTIKRYHEILDGFERYKKHNRILDVGCGIGYFLEVAKERGWEVYGTEITDTAVGICSKKGIKMHQGILNPSNYEEGFFDVITSFEVIEHIQNATEEISTIRKLLRKQGVFYVTTPNFNSFLRVLLKEKYNVISYPEHLSYYTPKTLTRLMEKNGFKKVKVQTTGISITRMKQSAKISQQKTISQKSDDEKIRTAFEEKTYLMAAKNAINSFLTFLGRGDNLKGTFMKV